jgi:hypothetical protein
MNRLSQPGVSFGRSNLTYISFSLPLNLNGRLFAPITDCFDRLSGKETAFGAGIYVECPKLSNKVILQGLCCYGISGFECHLIVKAVNSEQ